MKNNVKVIYGQGSGKSAAALGIVVRAASAGNSVSLIQFLKGNREGKLIDFLKRLEPEVKVFRFEKHTARFSELNESEKQEELLNIQNGFHFAKKVVSTHSCDVLVLDEVLALIDRHIMEPEELLSLMDSVPEDMTLILTGKVLPDCIKQAVENITRIENESR